MLFKQAANVITYIAMYMLSKNTLGVKLLKANQRQLVRKREHPVKKFDIQVWAKNIKIS